MSFKELNDNECNVSGGNAITDLAKTPWGKLGLSFCREDVRQALNDEDFTNKLLKADKSEIKNLFAQRGVTVSESEVNFCYNKIVSKLK